MQQNSSLAAMLTLATATWIAGCVVAPPPPRHAVVVEPYSGVIVRQPPPPLRTEVIGVAPSPRHVWVSGYWTWNNRWVWQRGRWVMPPHHGARWAPGHWRSYRGGWAWAPGHWR
jgi:hypothetical protein